MARLCDCNDLTSTTLAVLGTLNDTGQIENLNLRAVVLNLTRDSSELVNSQRLS
jgi:hypothetical protein